MKRNRISAGIGVGTLVAAAMALSSCAAKPAAEETPKSEVLATFDGGRVTRADFDRVIGKLGVAMREVALRQRKEFLESFVTEKLLLLEAESRGFQHRADVEEQIRQSRDRILINRLVKEDVESKSEISDAEVKSYYEQHGDEFLSPHRLRASHILVRTREEAESLKDRIAKGEVFEEIAKKYSMDPTAAQGGDIGYFERGQLVPEIEEVAFALKENEVSGAVQSPFGFHLLKITGEAKPQVKELSAAEAEIRERLVVDKKTKLFDELSERLMRKSRLVMREEALAGYTFSDGSSVPPAGKVSASESQETAANAGAQS